MKSAASIFALIISWGLIAIAGAQEPAPPPATTKWHGEAVREKKAGRNIVLYNHSSTKIDSGQVLGLLQEQYNWLKLYVGTAPRWVIVHLGDHYPNAFSIRNGPDPEMFLQAETILDTSVNYAHEMMHCFTSELGAAIPHWFNESMSDMAWMDSEIELALRCFQWNSDPSKK